MTDTATPKRVLIYRDNSGKEPFTEWLNSLRDSIGRKRILVRIFRLEQGNYGDSKPVGDGVSELRMFFGSGYRVYFGEHDNNIILLLCGGDKDRQENDIQRAKIYWKEYKKYEEL